MIVKTKAMAGKSIAILIFTLVIAGVKGEKFNWSSKDVASQAEKTSCKPLQKYENAALKSTTDSKDVQRTSLGAVDNAEVCGGLCCEMENCDLAEFDKLRQCYAVHCTNLKSCDVDSNGDSTVLTFSRKTGGDVWTKSFKKQVIASADDKAASNATEIKVTGDAPLNNTLTVESTETVVKGTQKSEIPEDSSAKRTEQVGEKSIIDAINEEQLAKIQSLTKELEETDKLETAASSSSSSNEKKDKIAAEGDVKGGDLKLGNQVLSATGEHYLKTDDKDITSFQENDTVSAHSKHQRKRNARHNIMSPITIGAFTCMAVIALSGFVMAIIKYKREHRVVNDKETQSP